MSTLSYWYINIENGALNWLSDPVLFHLNFKYEKGEFASGVSGILLRLAFDDVKNVSLVERAPTSKS